MENVDKKTRELIGALSHDAAAAEQALRDWFLLFPESLYRVAGAYGRRIPFFLQRLLASSEECNTHLCNPDILTEQAARDLARSLISVEPRLDIRLAQSAIAWAATSGVDRRVLRRCLAILEILSSGSRINSALVQLLNCGNNSVRSKVVEMLVRWSTNEANVREWLRDPDPRVRANVIESLAEIGQGAPWIRGVLLDNLGDRNGRAAANAAVGLYRMGVTEPALARLSEMALSEDASLRCSAVWAIGQMPDPKLFDVLNSLRTDADSRVRWLVLKSLSNFNRAGVKAKPPAIPEPVALPPNDPEPRVMEAAVTAEPPAAAAEIPIPGFTTRTFGRLL